MCMGTWFHGPERSRKGTTHTSRAKSLCHAQSPLFAPGKREKEFVYIYIYIYVLLKSFHFKHKSHETPKGPRGHYVRFACKVGAKRKLTHGRQAARSRLHSGHGSSSFRLCLLNVSPLCQALGTHFPSGWAKTPSELPSSLTRTPIGCSRFLATIWSWPLKREPNPKGKSRNSGSALLATK